MKQRLLIRKRISRTIRAFSLVEVCLAMLIVGLGLAASMKLFATCTTLNQDAAKTTVAFHLAYSIQEYLAPVNYASLDAFNGQVFGAQAGTSPIDALGRSLTAEKVGALQTTDLSGLSRYTQKIFVSMVSHKDLKTVSATDDSVKRVQVEVWYRQGGSTTDTLVAKQVFFRFFETSN